MTTKSGKKFYKRMKNKKRKMERIVSKELNGF
jgi:hypothetical protein